MRNTMREGLARYIFLFARRTLNISNLMLSSTFSDLHFSVLLKLLHICCMIVADYG
jgi:hypothetical protein